MSDHDADICEVAGCGQPAVACYLPDTDPVTSEPDGLLCVEHAFDQGFCWWCGQFWAGVEAFDWDAHRQPTLWEGAAGAGAGDA